MTGGADRPMSSLGSRPAIIDTSVQEVVYAGLDALQAAVSIDLCVYLHAPVGYEPQLYLAVPSLASIPAEGALDLFEALRGAADERRAAFEEGDRESARSSLAGFHAVVVRTEGSDSSGLHAVGRLNRPLDDLDRAVAVRLCEALGMATQRLESAAVTLALRQPASSGPG